MGKHYILFVILLQTINGFAQVPVSQEPRHHNVFENNYVRVLDVQIPPGDTSQFHKHEIPSVFIVLQRPKIGSQVIQEESKATALFKDASITFEGFYTTPRIHRVWNEDSVLFHVMDIELLSKEHSTSAPIEQKDFQLLFDEKPVRAYRLNLKTGLTIETKRERPVLIVGLSNGASRVSVNEKSFGKKGDFLFIPAGSSIRFKNPEQQPYSFAVLEIK
jgi:quercetin dioxygenase-like cupin family protein